jgi:hypothetical protein
MRRKIPTTFTVEFEQLERLGRVSDWTRLNRSSIVRDALERELRRYEEEWAQKKVVEVNDAAA